MCMQFPNTNQYCFISRTKLFGDSDSFVSPAKHLTFTDDDANFQLKPISSKTHRTMETSLASGLPAKQFVRKMEEGKDLIGDGSRNHTLPLETGKHTDLKCISPETVSTIAMKLSLLI